MRTTQFTGYKKGFTKLTNDSQEVENQVIEVVDPAELFINKLRNVVKNNQSLDRRGQQKAILNTVTNEYEFLKSLSVENLIKLKQAFIDHAQKGGFLHFPVPEKSSPALSSSLGNFLGDDVNQNKSAPLMDQLIHRLEALTLKSPNNS